LERRLARSQPFAVELLGDVNAVFAPGAIKHPLRPIFRKRFTTQLKRQCRKACAVAYVTSLLERDYPPGPGAFSTAYSMVDLEDNAFAPSSRTFAVDSRPKRVISVGTLDVLYKGFDVLMQAVSECVQAGLHLELVIVGDGRRRAELERFAHEFGIGQRVKFAGRLPPGAAVREALDGADLFVLASKTEGLPSAMIEAMARALPCIGSAVGGIPELLPTEDLVPRGDAAALAHKIREVLSDPQRMARMSSSNLARARDYHASVLAGRRRQFYAYLREATRLWNQRNVAPHPEGMSTYEGRAS
jgi:glycosyltransferase involved in cell wall biosynthesis